MRTLKQLRLVLWALVVVAIGAGGGTLAYREFVASPASGGGDRALVGGSFELVNGQGEPVTDADFHGRPFAIFFGFTHCPDVCPTSLWEMSRWIEALGPAADEMRFAFVTVDPERDTPEIMRDYVGAFSDRIIPLTGTTEQVDQVLDAYRVYARKVPQADTGYSMDHSAFVYLMDENGHYEAHITYGTDAEDAVAKLRALLG